MAGRYQTPHVRKNFQRKLQSMEECERNPVAYAKIQDKMQFAQDKSAIQKQLDATTPPDVTPEVKQQLRGRVERLKNAWVDGKPGLVPAWPTRIEEEKVPAGIIGQGIKHDQFWKRHNLSDTGEIIEVNPQAGERGLQAELKDLLRVVHKEDEDYDPDIANLERFRKPGGLPALADTHLPQTYGLSPQAKANYDDAFPDHAPTAVEQILAGSSAVPVAPSRIVKKRGPKPRQARVIPEGTPMCQVIRTDGSPCRQPAMPGKQYCYSFHHKRQIEAAAAPKTE